MMGNSRGHVDASQPSADSRVERRRAAAREALTLCAAADGIARDASVLSTSDEHRLLALLEQRDEIMQDLAEQLVILRHDRPRADSPLFAATERAVDEADSLIADVCSALSASHRTTMDLIARVARRAEEIRAELDAVQRTAHASVGYAVPQSARLVDRVR